MIDMIIKEKGKYYNIDLGNRTVTGAALKMENLMPTDRDTYASLVEERVIRRGDRVEVDGNTGVVMFVTSSVYGSAYAVKFDDNTIDEFPEHVLSVVATEEVEYPSVATELLVDYENYLALPLDTPDELEVRAAEARRINIIARNLMLDEDVDFNTKMNLDQVISSVKNDLSDYEEINLNREAENHLHRERESITIDASGPMLGVTGDVSWLNNIEDDTILSEITDVDLASRAADVVSYFSRSQLADDELMMQAISIQRGYLGLTDSETKKFASFVSRLREEELTKPEQKVASAPAEDLSEIDDSAIFI